MSKPSFFDKAAAALKAWRFSTAEGNSSAQVFWPAWPAQCPVVELEAGNWDESSLVMTAVNWTGTVFGEPILTVLTRNEREDTWTRVPNHPLQRLWEMPNPNYTGATMLKAFAYYWLVYGNVYIGKRRDDAGRLRELYLLDSTQVQPKWDESGDEFVTHYEVRVDGVPQRVEKRDLIHFRYGLDPRNHRVGLSPLRAMLEEILTDEGAISYSRVVLGNQGVPSFIVSPKPNANSVYTMNEAGVKAEIMTATTGERRGTPLAFSHPMAVDVIRAATPSEMALKDLRNVSEERFASVLGIPALALGFGFDTHATYSNYKTALEAAWNTFVIPTLKLIATEIARQLLPEFKDRRGEWVEFDTTEIWALQADQNQIATREVAKYNAGLVTLNEAREAMGLKPFQGGNELRAPAPEPMSELGQKALKQGAIYDELRDWWKVYGPPEGQGLLDAEVER